MPVRSWRARRRKSERLHGGSSGAEQPLDIVRDADTWFAPGFLESAVALRGSELAPFLSIYLAPEPARLDGTAAGAVRGGALFCGITRAATPPPSLMVNACWSSGTV